MNILFRKGYTDIMLKLVATVKKGKKEICRDI